MEGDGTATGYCPITYFAEPACSVTKLLVNMTRKNFLMTVEFYSN
jgi:hypothetical protein